MSESVASVLAYYTEDSCSGTPFLVFTEADFDCTSTSSSTSDCVEGTLGNDTVYYLPSCTQDRHTAVADAFGTDEFVGFDWYDDSGCTNYQKTLAFAATGDCYLSSDNASAIAKVFDDGSAELDMYWDTNSCSTAEDPYSVTKDVLDKSTCLVFDSTTGSTFFTRASLSSSSGISTGALIGIIAGGVVFLLLVAGGVFWYCRRKRRIKGAANKESLLESNLMEGGTTIGTTGSSKPTFPTGGESGDALWQDEIVISSRVPREKVVTQELLSRGGYGEVFKGTYNGQDVAIKMLLPETRRSLKHVNAFLAEVKMMATLEHSCIVQFVGVAWDSLNDLCVLSEFMAGGDLRALLAHYEAIQHPQGLDYHKVKIALEIAHALTYLHTLEQPVIHRDLKSKNVLLTSELHAKLTDFGVSRERIDATMTAGVGTSLWMAPEIMLGEKYGVEADVFSFGVMLSELDSHALPYATAKENSDSGRKLPDAAILQLVAMGKLRVQFSDAAPKELVELGLACVATEPSERPSASEALYRLQKALQAL